MIIVPRPHSFGHSGENIRRKPCEQDGVARSSAETGEQILYRLKGLAFAEYSFGQSDARGAGVVEKNAVIHDVSGCRNAVL